MPTACQFALSVLIATIVSCNANPALVARQTLPCFNFSCPATDKKFCPFAPDLSGPRFNGSVSFLQCYYPFLSNCQYNMSTGALKGDADQFNCQTAVQRFCTGSTCTYVCPAYDNATHPLGIGSGPQGNILFCTYPLPEQFNTAVLSCDYDQADGTLLGDHDYTACPQTATHVNASTPFCPSHSAVVDPTTVTPLPSPTSSISMTSSSNISSSTAPSPSYTALHSSSHANAGATAGGVVGGLFVLGLASYVLYRLRRRYAGPEGFSNLARRKVDKPKSEHLVHPFNQYHTSPDMHDGTGHRHTAEGTSYIPDKTNRVVNIASGIEMSYSGLPAPDSNDLNITEVAGRPNVQSKPLVQITMPIVPTSPTLPSTLPTSLLPGNGSTHTTAEASSTLLPSINNDPLPPREEISPPLPPTHVPRDDTNLQPQLEALRAELELLRTQQADVLRALHPPQYST